MRTIAHLDADAFFASVEQASDAKLRGKPIAVGGEKRGIIASASYEARRFGIHTPMPTARARKLCPKLIVLPGDFERYEQFSNWMFGYCYDFTPDVEQTSIDEGYFDLSGARKPPGEIARIIRKAIGQKLKISVSEGIGPNKLISAIASKLRKPAALEEVPRGGEEAFLHPLPNQWLPGIGPQTSLRLNAAGEYITLPGCLWSCCHWCWAARLLSFSSLRAGLMTGPWWRRANPRKRSVTRKPSLPT
ncbi:MAG: DNA polymerase IV [Verrucomicrobia bacterium]|nr:DNA polymerase IV [Verrucomicrobiota bacterium]